MTKYVGLDVSQKTTALCIVDGERHRLLAWGMHLIAPSDRTHSAAAWGAGASIPHNAVARS